MDAVPCFGISRNFVLLQNTAHMHKLLGLSFTGPEIQHLHPDEGGAPAAGGQCVNSSVFTLQHLKESKNILVGRQKTPV